MCICVYVYVCVYVYMCEYMYTVKRQHLSDWLQSLNLHTVLAKILLPSNTAGGANALSTTRKWHRDFVRSELV